METECGEDTDSVGSTDTVVASVELRSRWKEQVRRLHLSPDCEADMSGQRNNSGDFREATPDVPLLARHEIKRELDSSGNPVEMEGQRSVGAAHSRKPATASEPGAATRSDWQGWPTVTPGRPIKTEQPAVVVVPPYSVKLENMPAASRVAAVSREPARDIGAESDRNEVPPMACLGPNQLRGALSGSDSDFDEPFSDDGSELDGFDDFLEGITRELNDGVYSDLKDQAVANSPPPSQSTKAADQVVVKSEHRSKYHSCSRERLQLKGEMPDAEESDSHEANGVPVYHPLGGGSGEGEESASSGPCFSDVPTTEVNMSQRNVADRSVDSGLSQPNVLRASGLRSDDDRAREADPPQDPSQDPPRPSSRMGEVIREGVPFSSSATSRSASDPEPPLSATAAIPSGVDTFSSNEESKEDNSVSSQSLLDTTTRKVGDQREGRDAAEPVSHSSSPLQCDEHETVEDSVKSQSERTDAHTMVYSHNHVMVDQSIQVDNVAIAIADTKKESSSSMAERSGDDKECKMLDKDTQTDPPNSSAATHNAIGDLQSSCLQKTAGASADDGSAKHINDYCEKTFWLLENFSEGLSKEDGCDKTRSALNSAKEVRAGLNKRDGMHLSQQLNLCTNAVRSMLNALRKLTRRRPIEAPRKDDEVEPKEKPTEVVQPFTTDRDRHSSGSRPSSVVVRVVPDRPSHTHKPPDRQPGADPNSADSSRRRSSSGQRPGSPSSRRALPDSRGGTEHTRGEERTPNQRRPPSRGGTERTIHEESVPNPRPPPSRRSPERSRGQEHAPHPRPSVSRSVTERTRNEGRAPNPRPPPSRSGTKRTRGEERPTNPRSPPRQRSTERSRGKEHATKPRKRAEDAAKNVTPPEEVKNDSAWASRLFPISRKRIVEGK